MYPSCFVIQQLLKTYSYLHRNVPAPNIQSARHDMVLEYLNLMPFIESPTKGLYTSNVDRSGGQPLS